MRNLKLGWIVVSAAGSIVFTLYCARRDWKRVLEEQRLRQVR